MSIKSTPRPGSRITKVELHEFSYRVEGLGFDGSGNRCVAKGATSEQKTFAGAMKTAHLAAALGMDCEFHAAGPAQRNCMAAMRNSNSRFHQQHHAGRQS